MTLTFDLPKLPHSYWSDWDARWKLAATLVAIAGLLIVHSPISAAAALGLTLLMVQHSRLPWRWYVKRLAVLAPLLLSLFALLPLLLHGNGTEWSVFDGVRVSLHGLLIACRVSAKIVAIVTWATLLVASTPMPILLKAAHHLRVPGFLVQLTSLTWRYMFLVADEFRRIRTALRVRGYRPRLQLHNYHVIGNVIGTLLVRSAERAERVGQAMRCRGFDGGFRALAAFSTRPTDVAGFLIILFIVVALVVGDRLMA